jgi:hypothetical protein
MPNYNASTRQAIADIGVGLRVDRATAALPATTSDVLFTVSGGRVIVDLILGEVTTVIEDQENNTNLEANPTTGTATDICTALDIADHEAGTLYTVSGTAATAMQSGSSGSVIGQAAPFIVAEGDIELHCAATNTGSVKWSIWYRPLDAGAYVTAA